MKRLGDRKALLALILCLLIASVVFVGVGSSALAQSGGGYDLTWNKIAGGGATNTSGGGYELGGTIGQADAGKLSGGAYSLNGGFWTDDANASFRIFLPLILR